jgi:hypothetical protein
MTFVFEPCYFHFFIVFGSSALLLFPFTAMSMPFYLLFGLLTSLQQLSPNCMLQGHSKIAQISSTNSEKRQLRIRSVAQLATLHWCLRQLRDEILPWFCST